MAGYSTHLGAGIVVGTGVAFASLLSGAGLDDAVMIASMGALGGVAPDLDSDTSKPLQIGRFVTAGLVAMGLSLGYFSAQKSMADLLIFVVVSWSLIYFGLFGVFKKLTTHRGVMHSVPFAIFLSLLISIIFKSFGIQFTWFFLAAVFLGSLSHLFLDEANSLKLKWGLIPSFKRSFGSALKMGTGSLPLTIFAYGINAVLVAVLFLVV